MADYLSTWPKEKASGCTSFQRRLLTLDMYRRPFLLLLPDENDMYRTLLGSVLSILTLTLVLTYAGFKTTDLVSMRNYRVQTQELHDFYDKKEGFGFDDGFMIAGNILGYENGPVAAQLDPSIGKL